GKVMSSIIIYDWWDDRSRFLGSTIDYFRAETIVDANTANNRAKQRKKILRVLIRNDILLKLIHGQLPFSIEPEDHLSIDEIAQISSISKKDVELSIRFLSFQGLVKFYDSILLETSFFMSSTEARNNIKPFAMPAFSFEM